MIPKNCKARYKGKCCKCLRWPKCFGGDEEAMSAESMKHRNKNARTKRLNNVSPLVFSKVIK